MELFDAVCKRASVRDYKEKDVPRQLLVKLIDAARRAPSARAVEPWEFVVIRKKESLAQLGKIVSPNGGFIGQAAAAVAIYCRETKYYLEDGCAATENLLLMAADLGLGACWIAGDKKPYAEKVNKFLGIDTGMKLVSLISLGWPKTDARQKKNRKVDDVIHWEKFQEQLFIKEE
ncbi:MAG: nitroreductase family protein [Candidatus Omnitrophica bacterium]|nr:nitroreductase family protein [Candidatus Omnitrophota bacterium]